MELNDEPVRRQVNPRPGLRGWAHGERGIILPVGLAHKTPLEVLERTGWRDLIVRAEGSIWQLPAAAVDCGREYRTRSGLWIPESDERSRRYLPRLREALFADDRTKIYVATPAEKRRLIDEIEWILERNGWEVPTQEEES
ncbi:hypothetical protein OKA04_12450 [Luteolibacter flavescens]|uniref:Uncharacterized protein n=1 Tax=Luteolibacter flavescens TaxID=1859460 RepID=A0ABT3FPQ0_9BACT|nr:hypothetical protein [Luteolibacter flavescens]MCW1885542.1 hypothetical protein [Luteolibacter flavescens]